jgi:hypothetical protein
MSQGMEYWRGHLSAIDAEGISTKAYAAREGLSAAALYHWRKRMKAREAVSEVGAGFVALRVDQGDTPMSCTVVMAPGLRLELVQLPTPAWLAALSTALQARAR